MTNVLLLLVLIALQPTQASAPPAQTQACFELLADAEGEMALAEDPTWRKNALAELSQMRAEHRYNQNRIEAKLADYSRQRDRIQRDFDSDQMSEDDFTSARSEIQSEVRRLIAERDAEQFPACGF